MISRKSNNMNDRPFIKDDVYWFESLGNYYLYFFYDNRPSKRIHELKRFVIDDCKLGYRS